MPSPDMLEFRPGADVAREAGGPVARAVVRDDDHGRHVAGVGVCAVLQQRDPEDVLDGVARGF